MIKYLNLSLAFSLLLIFTACGDNDVNPDSLVGTWKAVSFTSNTESSTTFDGNTTSVTLTMTGENLDYTLVFTEDDFSTMGSYDVTFDMNFDGEAFPMEDQSYTNITGSGTYSTSEEIIILNGPLYNVEVEGVASITASTTAQNALYEINNEGQLVFTQNEFTEVTQGETITSSTVTSESIWERQ